MLDLLLGPLAFVGYVVVVGIALLLALLVFSTGGDRVDGRSPPTGTERRSSRSRSWWRRWR